MIFRHMIRFVSAAIVVVATSLLDARAQDASAITRRTPYPADFVAAMEELPVQDLGRVKALRSMVDPFLLQWNERRTFTVPKEERFGDLAGTKLSAVEVLLDLLRHPRQADEYPMFVVTDREILDAIGLSSIANTKRGRHSYAELSTGREKLVELVRDHLEREDSECSRLVNLGKYLYGDLRRYEMARDAFAVLRDGLRYESSELLAAAFPSASAKDGKYAVDLSMVIPALARLVPVHMRLDEQARDTSQPMADDLLKERAVLARFLRDVEFGTMRAANFAFLPPVDAGQERWSNLFEFAEAAVAGDVRGDDPRIALVASLERMMRAGDDAAALVAASVEISANAARLSSSRADAAKIGLEVAYLRSDWFYRAMMVFLLGFVLAAITWIAPRSSRWLARAVWVLAILGLGMVVTGITQRCMLLSRPPVSTLYETIVFITGVAVLLALLVEFIGRRKIALPVAVALGSLGLFIAQRYEFHAAEDTLKELQAVLRTNFWLGVHVVTVTIGYASTLLAGFIAHVFLVGKLFAPDGRRPEFFQNLGRMVYGVLCFATFFATFGTITGGIWANDSWGRFWGWDPKENGALLIVLAQLVILHARMGGLVRNWGMCFLAVLANCVVAFSWWHTNAMGIGLHSYGFDAGLYRATMIFYGSQGLVFVIGLVAYLIERSGKTAANARTSLPRGDSGPLPAVEV
ncbi:MAG: cytochrome c biogenesis protein [Planctomycetota bacterium]